MEIIELEDLQNLIIEKKLVQIEDTNRYSEEALQYIKNLVDNNRSILFEKNRHRIYTLGQYYGGDTLKENLLYFSKILSIDINDNIINEINASKNEDSLAFKSKDNILLNINKKDNYSEIEIGFDINNVIDKTPIKIGDNEYNLSIINDKIKFDSYNLPTITLDENDLTYENLDNNDQKEITIEIKSSLDFSKYIKFDVNIENCELIDKNENVLTLKVTKDINPVILINYNDGITENNISLTKEWIKYCYYGIVDKNLNIQNLIEQGKYAIYNNLIDNIFYINQNIGYYAYYICPENYHPYFIDNISQIQGAWYYYSFINKFGMTYHIYITDNEGLGNIEWKIINK